MSGKKQNLQWFLIVEEVLNKSLKRQMLPILHCDVATSMIYADHAQDHTWGYTVQLAGNVTTVSVLLRFFVQQNTRNQSTVHIALFHVLLSSILRTSLLNQEPENPNRSTWSGSSCCVMYINITNFRHNIYC
jgi:hypothetical protein